MEINIIINILVYTTDQSKKHTKLTSKRRFSTIKEVECKARSMAVSGHTRGDDVAISGIQKSKIAIVREEVVLCSSHGSQGVLLRELSEENKGA